MTSAKDIIVKPISSRDATECIRRFHYSGKAVTNSQLHFGVFLGNMLHGVMSFGPSLDKSKIIGLVEGTKWNDFIELNRMAFSDALPKNSESRAIGVALRLIRKRYPNIEWVVSFADGTQCGDGTIYRASGFVFTSIKESFNLARLPSGQVIHKMTLESSPDRPRPELAGKTYYQVTGGKYDFKRYVTHTRAEILPGFQLRYLYFINPEARCRLTVPVIPFARIAEVGASMYKGKKRAGSIVADVSAFHAEEGGSVPTPALHNETPRPL